MSAVILKGKRYHEPIEHECDDIDEAVVLARSWEEPRPPLDWGWAAPTSIEDSDGNVVMDEAALKEAIAALPLTPEDREYIKAQIPQMAADICRAMARLLQQKYQMRDGVWWLYSLGRPARPLTNEEVAWHTEQGHAPFVEGGSNPDAAFPALDDDAIERHREKPRRAPGSALLTDTGTLR